MGRITAVDVDGDEAISLPKVGGAEKRNSEMRESRTDPLTTERVFQMVTDQLDDIGYHYSSMERSEDFTERIDAILTRQIGSADPEISGYPRILTVYRVGGLIHVELYNFLKKFPTDNHEMTEVKEAIGKLFDKNAFVKMEIHE
jgi:hypothetical protein